MMLLLACVHTPPHDPLPTTWTRDVQRREELRRTGAWCAWEVETLVYAGRGVWPGEPGEGRPVGQNWCLETGETGAWFDVIGQDGPFVSTIVSRDTTEPDTQSAWCVTWQVPEHRRATLVEYDDRHADRRWRAVNKLFAGRADLAGYTLEPDSFVVRPGGHVAFCATPPGGARVRNDLVLLDVR